MKTKHLSLFAIIISAAFLFASCQKDTDTQEEDFTTQSTTHSDDQSRFSNESDAVANDVLSEVEAAASFSGRPGDVQTLICNATVTVDTVSNPRTVTIVYNGANCFGNVTRTGTVVVSMAQGVRWKNAGAVINVSFQNLRITRVSDNKSITINGTQSHTNVTGGLLINLPQLNTITHTITSSNMSVTFDNGLQRTWQVARQRTFTYSNGVTVTVTGTHTEGNQTGVAEWGTNRFGNTFTTAITQPLVMKQDCSFRLGSGQVKHTTSQFNSVVTFGLNASGAPTSCPGLGNYYMQIVWTGPAGVTHTSLHPY